MKKEVFFKNSRNLKLFGTYYFPKAKNPPLVILCHGFRVGASQSRTCKKLTEKLLKKNIATFWFDFTAHGKSQGKFKTITISQELNDLGCAIDFAFNNFKFNHKELALFGSSLGGMVAILHTAKDKRIKYLALKSPVSDFEKIYRQLLDIKKWKEKGVIKTYSHSQKKYFDLGYQFWKDGIKYNCFKAGKKIKIPFFIIHGEKDKTVPLQLSKNLFKNLSSPDKKLRIIKNANHWYEGYFEKMINCSLDWLINKLYND